MSLHIKERRFTTRFFLYFISILAVISACTKIVTSDVGSGLIPQVDGVTTKDTILEVFTKNAGEDTARIGLFDDHILGYTEDPLFGTTRADINVQLYPVSFPYYFDTTAIAENLIPLCLY